MTAQPTARPQSPKAATRTTAVDREKYLHEPEESLLDRYSPHQELPLSTGASLVAHVFVVLVFGLLATGTPFAMFEEPRESPSMDNIVRVGGGGGDGQGGGDPLAKERKEPIPHDKFREDNPTGITIDPEQLVSLSPEELDRMIEKTKNSADKAFLLGKKAAREGEEGKGGSGSGGGAGPGRGPGRGPGVGPGDVPADLERWILKITYSSPRDYLRKLVALDVILVVDLGDGRFQVYEDLRGDQPASKIVDLATLIKMVDGRLQLTCSTEREIRGLSELLGFPMVREIDLFMLTRESMYEELRRKEREFRGKTLAEISREQLLTEFSLNRVGDRWEIRVLRQYPKRD